MPSPESPRSSRGGQGRARRSDVVRKVGRQLGERRPVGIGVVRDERVGTAFELDRSRPRFGVADVLEPLLELVGPEVGQRFERLILPEQRMGDCGVPVGGFGFIGPPTRWRDRESAARRGA